MLGWESQTAEKQESPPSFLRLAVKYSSATSPCPKLNMDGEAANQPKHERSRTRWTPSYDRIFADLVVKHIQQGNRPNNVFDKKTWNSIRDGFNKQTGLNFNNNQLRKHLDVLRTRFYNQKSATVQNDFVMEDPGSVVFDLWDDIEVQPRSETGKIKDCPIYKQLCTIFSETSADGQYAQSSHFEGLEKSVGNSAAGLGSCPESAISHPENPSLSKMGQETTFSSEKVVKSTAYRKRKRPSDVNTSEQSILDEMTCEAMAEALLEMVAASKQRNAAQVQKDDKFSITNCIRSLDEIGDIDQQFYFAALDLFEDPSLRETFISLKGNEIRLAWLQGKCGRTTFPMYVAQDVAPIQSVKAFSTSGVHPSSLFSFPQFL